MSTWRRKAREQFPERALLLEKWTLTDWNAELGTLLKHAVGTGNRDDMRRAIGYISWCWQHKETDEQFVYFVENSLDCVLSRAPDRLSFFSVVDASSFETVLSIYAALHGSKKAGDLEREFRLRPKV